MEMVGTVQKLYDNVRFAADVALASTPLTIARTIFLHKNPHVLASAENLLDKNEGVQAYFEKTKSSDPLTDEEKNRIIRAVCNFDKSFLKSLIEAIELCEQTQGIGDYSKARVVVYHDAYKKQHRRLPTNRQLLEALNDQLPTNRHTNRVSLSAICKEFELELAKDRRGRPRKSEKK